MLNKELVNNFIDKMKNRTLCTVSIINDKGITISSTDSNLINNKNDKAKLAIKKAKTIEIINENKEIMEIIEPINYFNKVIGFISIAGECENIKEYSKLVIAAFELMLEQQGNFIKELNLDIKRELDFNNNKVINKILEENMGHELLNTLLVYINKNGERNRVAKELHIHRNTLNYRLNRIEEITGLSFNNYLDLRDYVTVYLEYINKIGIKKI
ncbi:helix-turn-helix domain-containing protein [Clostridium massiliamazoniense]|uniref:helix-turn-helix domain-containing protein n=1 Tax=Clostridium massiliamazoniense TaxID=1347366 RepID=UPI0006D7D846|nr:helix-turn-helix domain-containing protein [Clostridium massiliamazoniense]